MGDAPAARTGAVTERRNPGSTSTARVDDGTNGGPPGTSRHHHAQGPHWTAPMPPVPLFERWLLALHRRPLLVAALAWSVV